jgi:response regulator RpfG family c-di-GMP phosphodiesterase
MHARAHRPVLVVDQDNEFISSLTTDPAFAQYPPMIVRAAAQAQLLLSDKERAFSGIFVSPSLPDAGWLSVIRSSFYHRPAMPIFLATDSDELAIPEQDLKRIGVRRTLRKPFNHKQMIELVAPIAITFDARGAIAKAAQSRPAGASVQDELISDGSFVAVRADDFLTGSRSFFDVYVRLSASHYVKILGAGDHFVAERLDSLLRKGVTHLYLRKELQESYLQYCDHLATQLLKNDAAPLELKTSQTLNQGEETLNYLKANGVSEENLRYAQSFTRNMEELVRQIEPERHQILRDFMRDMSGYDHGVSCSMVAAILSRTFGIETPRLVQNVGIAALLHDIGLSAMPANIQTEDESRMSEDERERYRAHPITGAEALGKIRGVDPGAVQAIAQHHQRLNKLGFPARQGASSVNRVAELVGIADEFVRLMKRAQHDRKCNPMREMNIVVFPGFSRPVQEAFRLAFMMRF